MAVYYTVVFMFVVITPVLMDLPKGLAPSEWPTKPGTFTNCGNNTSEAYMRWTPAKVRFGDTLHISMHVVPYVTLKEGFGSLVVYNPDISKTTPVFNGACNVNCLDIHRFFMKKLCPFKKGVPVNIKNYKIKVTQSLPIPVGTSIVVLRLLDHEGGDELLCLKGKIVLLDD